MRSNDSQRQNTVKEQSARELKWPDTCVTRVLVDKNVWTAVQTPGHKPLGSRVSVHPKHKTHEGKKEGTSQSNCLNPVTNLRSCQRGKTTLHTEERRWRWKENPRGKQCKPGDDQQTSVSTERKNIQCSIDSFSMICWYKGKILLVPPTTRLAV